MSFDALPRNTEIRFISAHDPGVDWAKAAAEHDLTQQSYKDDPSEEKADLLEPMAGQKLTVFCLDMPTSVTINRAMKEPEGTSQAQELALLCVRSTEHLTRAGKTIELKRRADGLLDEASQEAIPWAVLVEIGYFLLAKGSGLSDPLSS